MSETVATSRQRILLATREEIEVSGIIGLRLNVIAEKAEVSVPLIFKYYGSREGLLTEVLSRGLGDLLISAESI